MNLSILFSQHCLIEITESFETKSSLTLRIAILFLVLLLCPHQKSLIMASSLLQIAFGTLKQEKEYKDMD